MEGLIMTHVLVIMPFIAPTEPVGILPPDAEMPERSGRGNKSMSWSSIK